MLPQIMATLEKRILAEALAQNDHRTSKTVRQLGINQRTLQKKSNSIRNTSKAHATNGQTPCPTIGFATDILADWTHCTSELWVAIATAARAQGVHLRGFIGSYLNSPQGFSKQADVLYDLIDPEGLEGLIIWLGIVANFVDNQAAEAFCARDSRPQKNN